MAATDAVRDWAHGHTAPVREDGEPTTNLIGPAGAVERLQLAREIHDTVMPALSAVATALSTGEKLVDARRRTYAETVELAVENLRAILSRPAEDPGHHDRPPMPDAVAALLRDSEGLADVDAEPGWETRVPSAVEPLVEHFLFEAIRNAGRHGTDARVELTVREGTSTMTLEASNDCEPERAAQAPRRGRLGLRLLATHALQRGAVVSYGLGEDERWHLKLVLPKER